MPPPPLPDVVDLDAVVAAMDRPWAPRIAAMVNDYAVKVATVRGEHVWHRHPDTDEVFIVLSGTLEIARRDPGRTPVESTVVLRAHDVYTVGRGVEHRPRSADGAVILMVEPAATLSTGDHEGPLPDYITSTTGLARPAADLGER